MRIVRKQLVPSNPDAVRITRQEKISMLLFAYAVAILEDLQKEIPERLAMTDGVSERLKAVADESSDLLHLVRLTIPMDQREHLERTMDDYEARFSPKATPWKTNVLMQHNEFKDLVDAARIKCRECTEDDESCEKCKLYRLLTTVLPLDDYHHRLLCPYNLGEWKN